jgi:hypothetical protein
MGSHQMKDALQGFDLPPLVCSPGELGRDARAGTDPARLEHPSAGHAETCRHRSTSGHGSAARGHLPRWLAILATLTALGLLVALQHIARAAVREGELQRQAVAEDADALWRCNALDRKARRDACKAQLNPAPQDDPKARHPKTVVNERVANNLSTSTLKDDAHAFVADPQGLMASLRLEGTKSTLIKR